MRAILETISPKKAKTLARLVKSGVLTINEVRKALKMEAIPEDEQLRRERMVFGKREQR